MSDNEVGIDIMRTQEQPDGTLKDELLARVDSQHIPNYNELLENEMAQEDPCEGVKCESGQQCVPLENGKPICDCIDKCSKESFPVCNTFNQTMDNECELYRQRCLCQRGRDGCMDPAYSSLDIEYLGACKEIAECTEDQLVDFPRRMAEWLFVVMKELAEQHALKPAFENLEKKAELEMVLTEKVPPPGILWKFCDLDKEPADRVISRAELLALKRPLYAMESCIVPFLDKCDIDNNHLLSLVEWGKCLNLKDSEVEDICNIR